MSEHKKVVMVDEHDEIIGHAHLLEAKEAGCLRRAVRVFVFDQQGRLLMQRRSENVFNPLRLDQSVGGHVDEGETYHEAAVREMEEELGLLLPIEEVLVSFRTERFFNGIYRVIIPSDTEVPFNTEEVAEVIWFEIEELERVIREQPQEFTGSFVEAWPLIRDKIIPS